LHESIWEIRVKELSIPQGCHGQTFMSHKSYLVTIWLGATAKQVWPC